MVKRKPGKKNWWYSFSIKGRGRFRGSTGTDDKELAEAYAAKKEAELTRQTLLGMPGDALPLSLDDALAHYLTHVAGKSSMPSMQRYARTIAAHFGKATPIDEITTPAIARFVSKRRGTQSLVNRGRDEKGKPVPKLLSERTINNELGFLRSMLIYSRDVMEVRVAKVRWRDVRLEEPDERVRSIKAAEARRLMDHAAPHLQGAILLALLTGLRLNNLVALDWSQIDLTARTITVMLKSRKPGGRKHVLPITPEVLHVLVLLGPKEEGRVFLYNGKPIKTWRHAWAGAKKRAGIKDFRWHDLRHTAAMWMASRGVRLNRIKEVLGHADIRSTLRYLLGDIDDKAQAMSAGAGVLNVLDPNVVVAHSWHPESTEAVKIEQDQELKRGR